MQRTRGQKITYVIAIMCYAAAVGFAIGSVFYETEIEKDPILASLMATSFFFASAAVVLHFIANARLKGLLSGIESSKEAPPESPGH
ncbi:MAG: hypothetical protein H7842_03060 [Gammaproteobacteria bacterium SHHR-1]|uniref:hypothetical protein n=1 Tax=Magnetovirga frankeli TaxID=947516 RepID=UPI001293C247|nr:hypothetical protein D5125_17220 [gamma proteobacterium SS-5]